MTKRRGALRPYPRTARLNQLFREILADELERMDDDRLQLVTVMSVEVDADMRHAKVYVEGLGGVEDDSAVLEALAELRPRLQAAIARQARVKLTPELVFRPDEVSRRAARVEDLLRRQHDLQDEG